MPNHSHSEEPVPNIQPEPLILEACWNIAQNMFKRKMGLFTSIYSCIVFVFKFQKATGVYLLLT